MLLAVDIGNTNIGLGVFDAGRLLKRYDIPNKQKTCPTGLKKIFKEYKINDIVICSVVPQGTSILVNSLRQLSPKKPYIIGKDIIVPVKNLYRHPQQVGQDRLVNAYAGISLYGAPLIAVDFGTAVTFDIISKNKAYLGGMILPGLQVSLDALGTRAALLPKIRLKKPKEFIGRDTKSSMLSGVVYGFACLTDKLIEKIKERIGKGALVIGTGGDILLIRGYCKNLSAVDRDLTLKGLSLIYHK